MNLLNVPINELQKLNKEREAEALRMGNITKQDFFNFARASEDLVFISMIRLP
ncbi:MAG: hypothetical protein ABF508_08640 [Zymomonas mobilis]|uniref:hypothetical protein n=1 Tax=Zymomonas mobilis TaxID=542 RepID=UPI0039EA9D5C